ncbi:hypothetical protein G5714_002595 [Onychostoma macrolepis]|uniref:Uncharacterized protein n=1 Tax=Onychostoma macrolepis TaxID=369639 RepID=A0A7J6D763_9TELE|nr:hypothetical protein G5714_002595 [Onychostoma macrolepis]
MPLPGDGTAGSVVSGWLAEIWDTQDLYTVSDVAPLFSSEKSWDVSRGFLLVKFQAGKCGGLLQASWLGSVGPHGVCICSDALEGSLPHLWLLAAPCPLHPLSFAGPAGLAVLHAAPGPPASLWLKHLRLALTG